MKNYQNKNCKKCIYRVGVTCRRIPPSHHFNLINSISFYPSVVKVDRDNNDKEIYQWACREYREK